MITENWNNRRYRRKHVAKHSEEYYTKKLRDLWVKWQALAVEAKDERNIEVNIEAGGLALSAYHIRDSKVVLFREL